MIIEATTAGQQPGLGTVVALVALLGAAILAYRRDSSSSDCVQEVCLDTERRDFLKRCSPAYWIDSPDDGGGEVEVTATKTIANTRYKFEVEEINGDETANEVELLDKWYMERLSKDSLWRLVDFHGELSSSLIVDDSDIVQKPTRVVVNIEVVDTHAQRDTRGQMTPMAYVGMLVCFAILGLGLGLVMYL